MVKVAVTGAGGRMGSLIARLALEDEGVKLVGVTERPDHPLMGGEFAPGVKFYPSILQMEEKPEVVIDFTTPEATLKLLEEAKELGTALVIGTTGFSAEQLSKVEEASKELPVLLSPNMSLGVNLLFKLVAEAAKALKDKGYDVEIFEIHHRFKKDAPSGTAVKLGQIVAQAFGKSLKEMAVYGRQGMVGPRKPDEMGILSARMGDVVGDHTVFFATLGERLELTHRATSRETFARGAIVAAKWMAGKGPGLYSMFDVLGF
ncbi:dihydrodipicolinate reductase [Thermovibrio ammonificans HB-1]|uniref:4-hydroxy-tetrahydrodipicolinate reductase n=1 Tax=Thermovibrio ammonificans (strain DSM 15698 / JCM 12110 / HB-1) TaxID=648996 RepID=E8T3M6_THEA1|nr:4-hydroxy-tetrahydrodipicolinate reductase [Thermovibrio ammonificans]ADU96157.1 dihydrodipicolinate reductase [Thermovibrio ammonificans HB-1]